jgi:hypothetical protein
LRKRNSLINQHHTSLRLGTVVDLQRLNIANSNPIV